LQVHRCSLFHPAWLAIEIIVRRRRSAGLTLRNVSGTMAELQLV
jgi:hypothetical protein